MMTGPALSAAQGAMPAGFAAFLANIGQVSPEGDGIVGFDQLLAAAPVAIGARDAATNVAATPIVPTAASNAVAPPVAPTVAAIEGSPTLTAEGQGKTADKPAGESGGDPENSPVALAPDKVAVPATAPLPRPETGAGDAAILAANLLVALNGAVPGQPAKVGKSVDTDTAAEPETEPFGAAPAAPAPPGVATLVVAATFAATRPVEAAAAVSGTAAPVAAAVLSETRPVEPAPAKPAAFGLQAAAPSLAPTKGAATTPETLPDTLPVASETPRARHAIMPPVAPPADAPVARGADAAAAPAMTVLFPQGTAPTAPAPIAASAPATIAERLLDMDSDGAWIDQLARDIAATKSDNGDISFRLMPRHLGRLDVAMRQSDEGVALKMDTQHEATATIVTAAQGRLVDELRQQGVRVAGAEVTHTPGDAGRQSMGQGQGRAATPDPAHLIETANERGEDRPRTDSEDRAANRRGRFA